MKYKYDLIRSERKSISIIISDENKITVRCPWGMHMDKIEKYLADKQKWIEKVVLENSFRLARNDDVIEFRQIYMCGVKLPLIIGGENAVYGDRICVKSKEDIEKLYVSHCYGELTERVNEFSALTKLTPTSVSVKSYKGRWGCCDTKNNLIFNYILFMLPRKMQDYVIVHELCHTLCKNHSPAFWKLVSDYIPDYKQVRAEMKEFSFLVTLY